MDEPVKIALTAGILVSLALFLSSTGAADAAIGYGVFAGAIAYLLAIMCGSGEDE